MKRIRARYKYAGKYAGVKFNTGVARAFSLSFFFYSLSISHVSRKRFARAERFPCSPIRYINILNRKSRRYTARSQRQLLILYRLETSVVRGNAEVFTYPLLPPPPPPPLSFVHLARTGHTSLYYRAVIVFFFSLPNVPPPHLATAS